MDIGNLDNETMCNFHKLLQIINNRLIINIIQYTEKLGNKTFSKFVGLFYLLI